MSNTATLSYAWAPIGRQPVIMCKQKGKERQTMFGSLNYRTGQITVSFAERGNYESFKKHLKKVLRAYPSAKKLIMYMDNVRYHHAKKLKSFLAIHGRLEIKYLPPYSPDLNPIERAWWYMRKKITHNRFLLTLKERKGLFWRMFSHFLKPNQELKMVCNLNY